MSERVLRNELEQLQTQRKDLEAELLVDHTQEFLTRRAFAAERLASARSDLAEVERKLLAAKTEENALAKQVEKLAADLRKVEQRRLSAFHFVLMPVTFVLTVYLIVSGLPLGVGGFAATLGLGFLFGQQLLEWASPGATRTPLTPNLRSNHGLVPFLGALIGFLPAAAIGWSSLLTTWSDFENSHLVASIFTQVLPALTFIGAIRARRAVKEGSATGGELAMAAAVVSSIALGMLSLSWVQPFLSDVVRPDRWRLERLALDGSVFFTLPPLLMAMWGTRELKERRWSSLIVSLIYSAGSMTFLLSLLSLRRLQVLELLENGLARQWGAFQLGCGALLLALDFARRERERLPTRRWFGVIVAGISLAAALASIAMSSF